MKSISCPVVSVEATGMPKKILYDDLPMVLPIMAHTVCDRVYTGDKWNKNGLCCYSQSKIDTIEAKRRVMTQEDKQRFANAVDMQCRDAYERNAEWFVKLARSKTNFGRDQMLHVWIPHWLVSFLYGSFGSKEWLERNKV